MTNKNEIRADYDVEIEYKPSNLTPENIWRMYNELTTQLAELNSDNLFIANPLRYHDFIDFNKMETCYFHSKDNPLMTCFGPVVSVFYFHYCINVAVAQYGKWYDIEIDLRDRPFPEEVHNERESKCSCFHKQPHYWEEGGGCLDDGSPRHATICPQCYRIEYTPMTKLRIFLDRFLDPFVPKWR